MTRPWHRHHRLREEEGHGCYHPCARKKLSLLGPTSTPHGSRPPRLSRSRHLSGWKCHLSNGGTPRWSCHVDDVSY